MLERDLQDYLFTHPEVLFPGQAIQEKHREFAIDGRRIDLLFVIEGVRHIVELKAVPLNREHVGQVAEYYGLMRASVRDGGLKMVLVAPSIPEFRKVLLEEIGIRCVEIQSVPNSADAERLRRNADAHRKIESCEEEIASWIPQLSSISYEDVVCEVTKESFAISHRMLRDSADAVRAAFSEYELLPIKMARAESPHVICGTPSSISSGSDISFVGGGAWWAYAFGESEQMPKNDLPNISVEAMPWALDLTVNAELRTSQAVMKRRIADDTAAFDQIIREHGGVQFQALMKLEHQPRIYHWIPLMAKEPGTWNGSCVLDACSTVEREYEALRKSWIARIKKDRPELSASQAEHMLRQNKRPNLALRLARPFRAEDQFWFKPYSEQRELFVSECQKLKPLIDFLR